MRYWFNVSGILNSEQCVLPIKSNYENIYKFQKQKKKAKIKTKPKNWMGFGNSLEGEGKKSQLAVRLIFNLTKQYMFLFTNTYFPPKMHNSVSSIQTNPTTSIMTRLSSPIFHPFLCQFYQLCYSPSHNLLPNQPIYLLAKRSRYRTADFGAK